MFLFNKDHFPLGDEGSYPNITVRLLDLCRLSAYLTASVRTVYVCMYVFGGGKFGKFKLIHLCKYNKRSTNVRPIHRVFPKRQTISEENYITCAVDTAVVTVFVEVEDEWQDVSSMLAI